MKNIMSEKYKETRQKVSEITNKFKSASMKYKMSMSREEKHDLFHKRSENSLKKVLKELTEIKK